MIELSEDSKNDLLSRDHKFANIVNRMSQTIVNIKIETKKNPKEVWSVGSGFLWDLETVITCAHVIDEGLN